MNIAMWGRALRTIPRLSKEEWLGLDVVARWLIATRSAVLVMTFTSAAIAGLLALRAGLFDLTLWLLLTLGLLMAHATNNLLNDLIDYRQGVDQDNYFRAQYGPQPLVHGLLSQRQLLAYVAVTGALALIPGVYLTLLRGAPALWLLLAGAFFVIFYTWPLKYIGMGEPAVLLVWGPLMVGGGYFVITGAWDWNVVIASLPQTLAATSVLFGKHIDKLDADRAKGIRTLPVLLGQAGARATAIGLFALQYVVVLYLIAVGYFGWPMLAVLGAATALLAAVPVYRRARPDAPPADFPPDVWPLWYAPFAFVHTRRFGALFMLGLLVDLFI